MPDTCIECAAIGQQKCSTHCDGEGMQRTGRIELRVVLGILHINGQAVTRTPAVGGYVQPCDLSEDCEFVIDLETAEAVQSR